MASPSALAWSGGSALPLSHALPPAPPRFPRPAGLGLGVDPDEALLVVLSAMSLFAFLAEAVPRACACYRKATKAQRAAELAGRRKLNAWQRAVAVVRQMLIACVGAPDIKPLEERAEMLEQQLTSTLLQQRWKQAQLQAALEQRETSAAEILHSVATLKDVALGMRGDAGARSVALEELERQVMEQAVRMQAEKDAALDSARFHASRILEQREREMADEREAALAAERARREGEREEYEAREARSQAELRRREQEADELRRARGADLTSEVAAMEAAARRASTLAHSKHATVEQQLEALEAEARAELAKVVAEKAAMADDYERRAAAEVAAVEEAWAARLERAREDAASADQARLPLSPSHPQTRPPLPPPSPRPAHRPGARCRSAPKPQPEATSP
eukprot:4238415-Prymnesium_polylepis.1